MKYKILTKSKKYYFTLNEKIFALMSILLIYELIKLSIFGNESANGFDNLLFYIILLSLVLLLILFIYGIFRFEKLQGELNGTVEFYIDKVILNENPYELSQIKNISLNCYDYYGKSTISVLTSILQDGGKSNGTGNQLILTFFNGKILKINFRQDYENQIYIEQSNFIEYCNQEKLNYMNLLDNLGISNYNKMQEFKKKYLKQFQ